MAGQQLNSLGYLSAKHNGAVRSFDVQDGILYSGGDDGVIFRFDSNNGYQFECFYPTKQQEGPPVPIICLKLGYSRQGPVLITGEGSGRVKVMSTGQRQTLGTLGFFQNVPVTAISAFVSSGVFAVLGDRTVHIMQWR